MFVSPDNVNLQYSGRIDFNDSRAPVLVYAASYVKILFRGTSVEAELENHRICYTNELGYFLDGVQGRIRLSDKAGRLKYLIADDLADETHELMLFKRMDACHMVTFYGFELDEEAAVLAPPSKPVRRMEVFGDSVSCGEVSEALDYVGKEDPEHDGEYSNSWYSYAWMTARKLNAELHDTSQGGIALLDGTGWFAAPEYKGIESCFDKIEYHPGLGEIKQWDFNRYIPHVVVIAIGQNDSHPVDYMTEDYNGAKAVRWRKHYGEFVRQLMKLYPRAQIILATTILRHDADWDRAIDEVCREIADARVHHFLYKRNGSGTLGHIRIPEAEEMAEELAAYIESFGETIWED